MVNGSDSSLTQLVGKEVTVNNLLKTVDGVNIIYTYNGRRFDLLFIRGSLGIDLEAVAVHHGPMHDYWWCDLFGGFKVVEQQLGIFRDDFRVLPGWMPSCSGRDTGNTKCDKDI